MMDMKTKVPIFIWIVLGMGPSLFFLLSRNVERKRRYFPPFIIGMGLLLIGLGKWIMGFNANVLVMVPAVGLISFLNIRNTRFCGQCGRTVHNQSMFSRMESCPKCGAKIE